MNDKLRHDASASISGTIYQFYVAVDKCFDLLEEEKVIIEKYGDITISAKDQIEVKHYEDDLTDLHENIWKTIDNWLEHNFDVSLYKNLILMTTQQFGARSSFKQWNEKNKAEKKQILDEVSKKFYAQSKQSELTKKVLSSVLDTTKSTKLLEVLDKFIILDTSSDDLQYFNEIKQKHGKGVLVQKRDDYINSILGYILSPTVRHGDSWEIDYDAFTAKVESLVNQFRSGTIIFPKKGMTHVVDEDQYAEHLFVQKIEDIEYHEVKMEAISDYVRTNTLISQELSKHAVGTEVYDTYEEEIKRVYFTGYRNACLDTNRDNHLKDSKKFYNNMTVAPAPNFIHYNDTPTYFKNGILHQMADDEKQNIVWKLKVDDE